MSAVTRRQALNALAGACAARRLAAAEPALHFAGLDHVEFTVTSIDRSLDFYSRAFGLDVMKNNKTPRRYIRLGSAYIAFDTAAQIRVDHFCAGIDGFDVAAVHAYLQDHGIAYRDFPSGKDLAVTDADGIRTQLAASNGWDQLLKGTASAMAFSGPGGIFRPTGLDHILLNVSDPEKSAEFYAQIFGPVASATTIASGFNSAPLKLAPRGSGCSRRPRGPKPASITTASLRKNSITTPQSSGWPRRARRWRSPKSSARLSSAIPTDSSSR